MDKGFNDDELADIMSEIESLEKEFTDEPAAKKVMEQLVEKPQVEVAPVQDQNIHHIKKDAPKASKQENSMNFSVQGDMKLNLSFDFGGKCIEFNIDEDGFEIEVDGGMKFSIPVDGDSFKKSA